MSTFSQAPKPVKAAGGMAGALLFLVLYQVLACGIATQFVAWRLAYHPALGLPWFGRIYAPWAWLRWQQLYYASAHETFSIVYIGYLAVVAAGFGVVVLVRGLRRNSAVRHEGIHGTAHWATEQEVRDTGLIPKPGQAGDGVYCGGWTDAHGRTHYLRHNGPEHVAALAPTRSGKGLSLVLPTLLSCPHSVVVNDQKAELWNLTAGWRKEKAGNAVMKFDPGAPEGSVSINPLEEIRTGTPHEVGDTQNLVTILVDPDGKGLVDHWAKTAHAFLVGAILHLQYLARAENRVASLPDVALALSDPATPIDALYQAMLANTHLNGQTHPTVAAAARDMLNRPDEERGSVLSTAMSFLSLYRDPLVAANVSRSDFHIMDLMNHEKPVTLYLVVRAEDKDRMKPLMRLIINQIVRVLLRPELKFDGSGRPIAPHRHKMLLMLDEFPSYGKLEVFQEALAYIAGYGIKAYLIMQDREQLLNVYGQHETVLSNCHVRIAYAPNQYVTAQWISNMAGTTTVVKEDISTSGHRFGAVLHNVSRTFHEVSRPLITPDEAMRLKAPLKDGSDLITAPGDVLVFVAGHAPIYGTQSLYFLDPVFRERIKFPVPVSDRLRSRTAVPGVFTV